MTFRPAPSPAAPAAPGRADRLAPEALPMLAAGLGGAIVPLAGFFLAGASGVPGRDPVSAFLALAVIWVAIAPPILAAGPDRLWGGALRAASAVGGTLVALIVLWARAESVSFVGAMEVYGTLAAVALAGALAGRCARSAAGRYAAAVLAAGVQTAVLAAPFAIGGLLGAMPNRLAQQAVSWCYHVHPLASAMAALRAGTNVVWGKLGWAYWVSDSGGYPSAVATPWYSATLVYLALAGVLAGGAILAGRRATGSPETPAEAR